MIPITTVKCGVINCYVQGDLSDKIGKTIFLTVHDMGTNREFEAKQEIIAQTSR